MAITLRNTKGSALTYTELDDNFLFLSTSYVKSSLTSSMTVLSSSFARSASWAPSSVINKDTTIYSVVVPISNFSTNNAVFLGTYAGQGASSANYSNFLGINAGVNATSAANSNFFGNNAGNSSTNAQESNFLGYYAGYNAAEAQYSNFIGHAAGSSASSASYSSLIGYYAGHSATNASQSVLIGNQAGRRLTGTGIGPNNIIIGTNITLEDDRKDSINLGNIIYATGSYSDPTGGNQSYTPMPNARVGINKSIPEYTLDVSGSGNYTGGLTVTGSLLISGSPGEGIRVIPESGNSAFFAYDSYIIARDFTNNNRAYIAAEDSTSTKNATIAYHTAFGPYVALKDGTYNGIITTGSNWSSTYFYRLPAMSGEIAVFPYTGSAQISGSLTLTGSIRISGSLVMSQSASFVAPVTASSAPIIGAFYFDFSTTPNKLYAYNGSQWVTASLG